VGSREISKQHLISVGKSGSNFLALGI